MGLELLNIVGVIEVMENYIESIRPEPDLRDRIDINYKIDNQSVIIYEIRPKFSNPAEKQESPYAKATYVKTTKKWKVYWMPGNLKWLLYEPNPEVAGLKEFTKLVEEDKYHCFKG